MTKKYVPPKNRSAMPTVSHSSQQVRPFSQIPRQAPVLTECLLAPGIYWEDKCGKTIDAEVQSGDPDEVNDPGSDNDNPDGNGGGTTTSSAGSSNVTPPPIGPLTSCSLVQ